MRKPGIIITNNKTKRMGRIETSIVESPYKIDDAKNWCNAKTTSGIISCCTGKYKTSGKHPTTNDSLKWMYYKDYIKEFDESTLLSFDRLSA